MTLNEKTPLIFRILDIDSNYVQLLPRYVQIHPHMREDLDKFDFLWLAMLFFCI